MSASERETIEVREEARPATFAVAGLVVLPGGCEGKRRCRR